MTWNRESRRLNKQEWIPGLRFWLRFGDGSIGYWPLWLDQPRKANLEDLKRYAKIRYKYLTNAPWYLYQLSATGPEYWDAEDMYPEANSDD